jgi:serine/threonine protein kinase/tetratricopeptide (TPR) repeat protein
MSTAEEIVAAALRITLPTERQFFIERVCADDANLRRRVDTLLKTQAETILAPDLAGDPAVSSGEGAGSLVGPYKLLRAIGAGGMGVVWVAGQEYPIRREVALKIIKPGMDSGEVIARFEAERQTLAMMDHPNIAKVLDAGTTGTGRPYFVMELVQGVPITEYCDAKRLGPRERLELLVPVCRAIQHAHQKGIIHRDIKPSNVLVSSYDGQPTPKVIDFGIAKATGPSLTDSKVTQFGAVVGTLEYMSPEQAQTGGADIDTRSDIYSLGVVMYQLLTGRTPLDWGEAQKAGYFEVLRRVREEEPPAPSARLTKSPETLAEVAELRGTEPARLPKLLRGELDWIVMKALEKDRTRRYETANSLGRDIERYLNGEPVEASPPSATYRARKFARRHRLLLATAAGFLALLIAGIVVSAWQAVRARRAERAAMAERDRVMAAERSTRQERDRAMKAESSAMTERDKAMVQMHRADTEAETSRVVNEFLRKDLLGQASADNQARPDQKPDPDLKVRTALDRAAARIEGAFKGRPLVEASIRQTIGSAYTDLGLYKEARAQLEQALKLRFSNQPPEDPETLKAKEALANLYAQQRNLSAALALVQGVLKARRLKLGPEHPDTLEALNDLAALRSMQGRLAEGEPLLRQVLQVRIRTLGPLHPDTLESEMNLAAVLRQEGKLVEAEPFSLEAVTGYRKVLGPDHPRTLLALWQLGEVYLNQNQYSAAETVLRETLSSFLRVLGPEHGETAQVLNALAQAVDDQNRFSEAEPLYRRALAAQEKALGDAHPDTLATKHNLALLYQKEHKYTEAEAAYAGVIRLRRQVPGSDAQDLEGELAGLGAVRLELRKFAEAESVLRECLELRMKRVPNGYPRYNSESLLGASLAGQGRYSEAEPFLLSGYEGMRQLGGNLPEAGKPRFKLAGERIVQLYESWSKPEKAAEWRERLKAAPH